jgi:Na+/H+ antiporter NhaA
MAVFFMMVGLEIKELLPVSYPGASVAGTAALRCRLRPFTYGLMRAAMKPCWLGNSCRHGYLRSGYWHLLGSRVPASLKIFPVGAGYSGRQGSGYYCALLYQ